MRSTYQSLLCFSFGMLTSYIESRKPSSDVAELYDFLKQLLHSERMSEQTIVSVTESAYSAIQQLSDSDTIECNLLGLTVNCLFIIIEFNYLRGSQLMRLNRLTKSIYSTLESNPSTDLFRETNLLGAKLISYYEEQLCI